MTQTRDLSHLINSAATGQAWAQREIAAAYEAEFGTTDYMPEFSEMSSTDEELRETLAAAFEALDQQ